MSLERIALAEMLHEAECACGYLDQSYVDQADDLLPLLNARIDTAVAERLAAVVEAIESMPLGKSVEIMGARMDWRPFSPEQVRVNATKIANTALSTAKEASRCTCNPAEVENGICVLCGKPYTVGSGV